MKRTTTTREYDVEGKLTREVIEETEHADVPAAWPMCTCSVTAYTMRYCPLHGYTYPLTYTSTVTTVPRTGSYTINSNTAALT